METIGAIVGILGAVIGLILGAIALTNKILRGIEAVTERVQRKVGPEITRRVLLDVGLIKEIPNGYEAKDMWPNGWNNLPDSLRGMWQASEALEAEVHGRAPEAH